MCLLFYGKNHTDFLVNPNILCSGAFVESGSPQSLFSLLFWYCFDTFLLLTGLFNPIPIVIAAGIHEVDQLWACPCATPLPLYQAVGSSPTSGLHRPSLGISPWQHWTLLNSQGAAFYCFISLRIDILVGPSRKGWMFLIMLTHSLEVTHPHFLKTFVFTSKILSGRCSVCIVKMCQYICNEMSRRSWKLRESTKP